MKEIEREGLENREKSEDLGRPFKFFFLRIKMKFIQFKILSYPISQNENFYTVQNPNTQINSLIELKKIIIK